jgi:NAD(P) transhydrogenase subunit beta
VIHLIQTIYFITAVMFILGLKKMSSPATAHSGIVWAGVAMTVAVAVTLFWPGMGNYGLMITAIVVGATVAWYGARRVAMTGMPQMVAIYNGMGGGAAGAIAAVELFRGQLHNVGLIILAVAGGLIGAVAFSGSTVAFAKLQRLISERPIMFRYQSQTNLIALAAAEVLGLALIWFSHSDALIVAFFVAALVLGILMTLPIGGADMPVVISMYNAFTGLAVGFEGFALGNAAMIVAGTVVGASGTMLTQLMAKAMNRPLSNVLFSGFGKEVAQDAGDIAGSLKPIEVEDAAIMMGYAAKVIVVTGYGMALAQAQHKVRELSDLLESRDVEVKFAIHPVAGRMPGHMNVLLAEAGVPYEKLHDLEEINAEFPTVGVALVIGANDVVNPAAQTNRGSPLYGMPILQAEKAENVLVVKRGQGKGFAGVENELFFRDNTRMLYGNAQEVINELIQALKQI